MRLAFRVIAATFLFLPTLFHAQAPSKLSQEAQKYVRAQSPQVALTLPILVGLDGVRKMSKSLGNYIGITEPPEQIFGKVMSISDELMIRYYELLSDIDVAEFESLYRVPSLKIFPISTPRSRRSGEPQFSQGSPALTDVISATISASKSLPKLTFKR